MRSKREKFVSPLVNRSWIHGHLKYDGISIGEVIFKLERDTWVPDKNKKSERHWEWVESDSNFCMKNSIK